MVSVACLLEALASLGGLPRTALHAQLASVLDAVIHVARDDSGTRRVAEISIFVGKPRSRLVSCECAVHFRPDGGSALGPGGRQLERMLGGDFRHGSQTSLAAILRAAGSSGHFAIGDG